MTAGMADSESPKNAPQLEFSQLSWSRDYHLNHRADGVDDV